MKKIITMIMALLLMVTGCASDKVVDPNKPYAGTTINVYNWGDYIAEDTLEKFTEATGIKVVYETFDSNEIMYAKYKSGAVDYDILMPSDYMIEKLIAEDELVTLDMANIPNASYIEPEFVGRKFDPEAKYAVPYMWGTIGILYNKNLVQEEVKSWDILWDPTYSGQVIMMNSVRDSFGVALKKLDYSLNTLDQGQVDEALNLLIEQAPLVGSYVVDEAKDKMIGEEGILCVTYSGTAYMAMSENENLAYALPEEGTNLWIDAMVIPKTTKNKAGAEAFINFMYQPDIAYENTVYIEYSTPHSQVKAMLDEEVVNDLSAYPSAAYLEKCEVYVDLGPEMTSYYNEKWNELKAKLN